MFYIFAIDIFLVFRIVFEVETPILKSSIRWRYNSSYHILLSNFTIAKHQVCHYGCHCFEVDVCVLDLSGHL